LKKSGGKCSDVLFGFTLLRRRHFLASSASALVAACDWASLGKSKEITGSFVGTNYARGHTLRDGGYPHVIEEELKTTVAIVGGGVAGLAVARQLRKAGITDYRIFELEDGVGGNSRGMSMQGIGCPMGAHYLPTPDERNHDLNELLQELKLLRIEGNKRHFDERFLCHSPQERLLTQQDGKPQWQDGLLPIASSDNERNTLANYADQVGVFVKNSVFTIPTASAPWNTKAQALDQISFAQWLNTQGLKSEALQWYLDYCCRDDYGAGMNEVSAWAGLHYFASRHGFSAPGSKTASDANNEGVLTWSEGNGYLVNRLAAPHAAQTDSGTLVTRVVPSKAGVQLHMWDTKDKCAEIVHAEHVVMCTPLFISKRLLREYSSDALNICSQTIHYSPWCVANVYVPTALGEWPGAQRSWDNVMQLPGQVSPFNLGYVDAMHQNTRPTPASAGPTVLSCYYAYGIDPAQRKQLLERTWKAQSDIVLNDLALAHPDIREHAKRIDIVRYGHAMAVPTPGLRSSPALEALRKPQTGRVHFAHSDLSAYSVFEEAFYWGTTAGARVAKLVTGSAK
jgi:protoporphyrinogen oxidase